MSALAFSAAAGSKVAPGPLSATCCGGCDAAKNEKECFLSMFCGIIKKQKNNYKRTENYILCVCICANVYTHVDMHTYVCIYVCIFV